MSESSPSIDQSPKGPAPKFVHLEEAVKKNSEEQFQSISLFQPAAALATAWVTTFLGGIAFHRYTDYLESATPQRLLPLFASFAVTTIAAGHLGEKSLKRFKNESEKQDTDLGIRFSALHYSPETPLDVNGMTQLKKGDTIGIISLPELHNKNKKKNILKDEAAEFHAGITDYAFQSFGAWAAERKIPYKAVLVTTPYKTAEMENHTQSSLKKIVNSEDVEIKDIPVVLLSKNELLGLTYDVGKDTEAGINLLAQHKQKDIKRLYELFTEAKDPKRKEILKQGLLKKIHTAIPQFYAQYKPADSVFHFTHDEKTGIKEKHVQYPGALIYDAQTHQLIQTTFNPHSRSRVDLNNALKDLKIEKESTLVQLVERFKLTHDSQTRSGLLTEVLRRMDLILNDALFEPKGKDLPAQRAELIRLKGKTMTYNAGILSHSVDAGKTLNKKGHIQKGMKGYFMGTVIALGTFIGSQAAVDGILTAADFFDLGIEVDNPAFAIRSKSSSSGYALGGISEIGFLDSVSPSKVIWEIENHGIQIPGFIPFSPEPYLASNGYFIDPRGEKVNFTSYNADPKTYFTPKGSDPNTNETKYEITSRSWDNKLTTQTDAEVKSDIEKSNSLVGYSSASEYTPYFTRIVPPKPDDPHAIFTLKESLKVSTLNQGVAMTRIPLPLADILSVTVVDKDGKNYPAVVIEEKTDARSLFIPNLTQNDNKKEVTIKVNILKFDKANEFIYSNIYTYFQNIDKSQLSPKVQQIISIANEYFEFNPTVPYQEAMAKAIQQSYYYSVHPEGLEEVNDQKKIIDYINKLAELPGQICNSANSLGAMLSNIQGYPTVIISGMGNGVGYPGAQNELTTNEAHAVMYTFDGPVDATPPIDPNRMDPLTKEFVTAVNTAPGHLTPEQQQQLDTIIKSIELLALAGATSLGLLATIKYGPLLKRLGDPSVRESMIDTSVGKLFSSEERYIATEFFSHWKRSIDKFNPPDELQEILTKLSRLQEPATPLEEKKVDLFDGTLPVEFVTLPLSQNSGSHYEPQSEERAHYTPLSIDPGEEMKAAYNPVEINKSPGSTPLDFSVDPAAFYNEKVIIPEKFSTTSLQENLSQVTLRDVKEYLNQPEAYEYHLEQKLRSIHPETFSPLQFKLFCAKLRVLAYLKLHKSKDQK